MVSGRKGDRGKETLEIFDTGPWQTSELEFDYVAVNGVNYA